MMTPEQAFEQTLEKYKEIASEEQVGSHLDGCGFCKFDNQIDLRVCRGCPVHRHLGTDCDDIPAVGEIQKAWRWGGGEAYRAAAAKIVTLLEENKDGLIAAGHAILEEVENV